MIAEMERLELVCLRPILKEMVQFLQDQGVMHVEDVPLAVENARSYLHRVRLSEEEFTEEKLLTELDLTLNEIVPLLISQPSHTQIVEAVEAIGECNPKAWRKQIRAWSRNLRSLTRRRKNLRDDIKVMESNFKMIEFAAPLMGRGQYIIGKNAYVGFFEGKDRGIVQYLQSALHKKAGSECQFECRRYRTNRFVGVITFPEAKQEAVDKVIGEEGVILINPLDKELDDLPFNEMIISLRDLITGRQQSFDDVCAELAQFSTEKGAELAAMKSAVHDRREQLRVVEHLAQSELVGVIQGWVPKDQAINFIEAIEDRFGDKAQVGRLPLDKLDKTRIPTLLIHNRHLQPFEVLLAAFKPPTYGTYDPTALVAAFFVFFYGFILGDIAYGLVILGFAYWLKKRFNHIKIVRSATIVAMYCGISATVFGILFGELLGDLGHQMGLPQLWFHRGNDTKLLLVVAIGVGAVHIILSLLIGFREALRHNDIEHMGERMGMLLGLIGLGFIVINVLNATSLSPRIMSITAGILIISGGIILVRTTGSFAPLHMLEVISLFSNVLSYSRLMALGIASIALAEIANEMVNKSSNIVVGVIFAILIHIVNICIGVFSPAIHSLRLNYVEFLPKFFSAEGKTYEPFKKEVLP